MRFVGSQRSEVRRRMPMVGCSWRSINRDMAEGKMEETLDAAAAKHAEQMGMWGRYDRGLEEKIVKLQAEVDQEEKRADEWRRWSKVLESALQPFTYKSL